MRLLTLLTITALLTACSPEWHLRQAVAKDPALFTPSAATVRVDTIIEPLFLTEEVVVTERDTVTVFQDRIRVRVERSFDTLRMGVECPGDTIVIDRAVECPPQAVVKPRGTWWKWRYWLVLGAGVGAYFAIRKK